MTRRVARRMLSFLLIPLILASVPAPQAFARQGAADGQGAADQQGAAAGEAAPAGLVLSLDECLKSALENNLNIAVARFDPMRSHELVTAQQALFDPSLVGAAGGSQDESTQHQDIAATEFTFPSSLKLRNYSAGFLDPLITGGSYRFDVTANDSRFLGTQFDFTSFTTFPITAKQNQVNWKLTYNQPLLRNSGPRANRWQIVTARNNLGTSEAQFRQTVMDTLSAAEKAYWDLNFAIMDLKTKRTSLQLARDFLEQNRIKVRVGTLAPIEITQAEAGVADREEGVILAENAVLTAEDALRQVMNVPKDSPAWSEPIHPSDAPPLNEVVPDMQEATAAAESNRPDLEQARLALKSKETELYYRRNQKRWGLDFTGNYGRGGVSGILVDDGYSGAIDHLRTDFQIDWSLGLNLSVPIGNRQAISNFTRVEYETSQARFALQRTEQAARVEVRNAVRQVETSLKRVKAGQVNVRLQREKLEAEQKKYENGMSTSFQVLSFQTDLASAESRENQAITDYNTALVELDRVKGTLLDARRIAMPGKPEAAFAPPRHEALPSDFPLVARPAASPGGSPGAK